MLDFSQKNLPLFPLGMVLFPKSHIKIHIFEEKYKELFNDSNSTDRLFGVSLSIEEKIFNIGCIARIVNVLKSYENGNLDIVIEGMQRFKLKNLIKSKKLYLVGEVENLNDVLEPFQFGLQNDTISLYDELVKIVYKGKIDTSQLSKVVKNISFKVAEKIGMTLLERQALLELTSETERLKKIFEYLKDIIPRLEDFNVMQNIVQNDGYV
jgi:Lon protease-like protein